jgi:hypothetical protein
MPFEYNPTRNYFSFQRVRLEFEVLEERRFPEGKAGNILRGELGWALHERQPEFYVQYFEPRQAVGPGPSGFANPPRLFVLRAHHLEGKTFHPGENFRADLHLFRNTPAGPFVSALGLTGLGRLRNTILETITVRLDQSPKGIPSSKLTVRFLTPTELKSAGEFAGGPDFPKVFARARDRIRALASHTLTLDFDGMAQRAGRITLISQRITSHRRARTSSKTGQTHPIGGFTGEATYEGDVDEFVPLLQAAHWTGIGRQTVWGKGVIQVVGACENETIEPATP